MVELGKRAPAARAVLLASAATWSLVAAGATQAATLNDTPVGVGPASYVLEPQTNIAVPPVSDPSIVIAPPGTSVTDRDPTNVTGIGQMIIDQKNGFIGLCTGTLINPRTVIFAAHCVNESPTGTAMNPWGYGTGTGQLPIAFGFQTNNNLAGNSAFGHWLNGTAGGAKYLTSITDYLYNVNQVQYNAHSLDLGLANNFLQADVAVASLDTPAANVPTWALLFSALPAPTSISDTTGTGYHVAIAGYGNTGTATSGASVGVDYRRRLAENYLGLLGSLDDIDIGLFGIAPRGRPQNLYQIDFDSSGAPNSRTNGFDFNIFKDNALPGEGITGPGDSGGPLILDRTYAKQLVIAVLSGGSRYSNAQPSGSYGTSAFYQPLYLYWDYIAAANPYRYVSTLAGDGNWTDPTHWVTNLDPAYNVIVNGALVNGVPTTAGQGTTGTSGKFGQICDQEPNFAYDVCYDVKTGVYYDHGVAVTNPVPGTTASSTALPAATLANGLPGATNFVPNNINPDSVNQINARYFDVTLAAAGTTTLGSAVTIDRLTLNGTAAKLTVNSGASLTSLININQLQGLVTNNGTVTSVGDYLLLTGGITGAGRFNAPFFTSVSGMIMPGTAGTIGTITFGGNLILSSGTVQFIDLGPANTSDKLAVTGAASVGGIVGFAPVAGHTIRYGDVYTILTAQGGVTGTYAAPTALSAILTPRFIYSANAVQVAIDAGLYANVVGSSPVQRAYAQLLDQNRSIYNTYAGVYGPLDLQNAATIQGTLDSLAPREQTLKRALGTLAVDNMQRFTATRLANLDHGDLDGTLAIIGNPLVFAASRASGDVVASGAALAANDTALRPGKLPETVNGYIAAGYLNGNSRPMPTAVPLGARDTFDGFYVVGGIEGELDSRTAVGMSFSYTNASGSTTGGQYARADLFQTSAYGKIALAGPLTFDVQASLGFLDTATRRSVSLVGTPFTLRGHESSLTYSTQLGLGYDISVGGGLKITPRAALRAGQIDWAGTNETGGGTALRIAPLPSNSVQALGGVNLSGGKILKPYLSAYYVHAFRDQPSAFGANFVGGVGPNASFALAAQDKDWGEIGGGLSYATKDVTLSIGADTTAGRTDISNQSYRATVKIAF
ncbi:autotransporter domain-containing protein [Sphingomonas sp. DC1600-2]|uniref:autotransporter domain-containing protein n=1 Tax=unclassified Sphingomonas TaxID=196159 RepID=UPI003CF0C96C